MGTNRQDEGSERQRLQLVTEQDSHDRNMRAEARKADLVFDFTNVHSPDFADLSLILTARLQARPHRTIFAPIRVSRSSFPRSIRAMNSPSAGASWMSWSRRRLR